MKNAKITPDLSTPLEVTIGRTIDAVQQTFPQWQHLAQAVATPSCFDTPSYFCAWAKSVSGDVEWSVLFAWRGGVLCGVMPVMEATVRRGPKCAPRHDFSPDDRQLMSQDNWRPFRLRQLSAVVSMPAIYSGPAPLCHDDDRSDVIAAFATALGDFPNWDSFVVPVDAEKSQDIWVSAVKTQGLHVWEQDLGRTISGIAKLEPFDVLVARQNRNFRKNVRRAERSAQELGIEFVRSIGAKAVHDRLPDIADVARQSWKAEGRDGQDVAIPYEGSQAAFVAALLAQSQLDQDARPILAEAQIAGETVAVLLSLQTGTTLTALLTFRKNEAAKASSGLLLIGSMIDWAVSEGITTFDLNLTQNWARHLTNFAQVQNIVVAYARSPKGAFLNLISRLTRALK